MKRSLTLFLMLFAPFPAVAQAPETLTLDRALELALTHGFTAREAAAESDAARAGVGEAAMAFVPRLSGSVSGSGFDRTVNPDYFFPLQPGDVTTSGNSYSTNLSLSYSLLNSTRRLAFKQARLRAKSADLIYSAARRRLIRDVAVTYLDVVEADSLARVAEGDRKRRANALEEARELVGAGRRAEFEVLRARAELLTAQARKLEAENQREVARAELSRVVGSKLPAAFTAEMPALPAAPTVDDKVLERRPEAKASSADTRSAKLAHQASMRQYLPSLGVSAGYNRLPGAEDTDLIIENFTWSASLSIVLGDAATTAWRARGAKARARAAQTIEERRRYELEIEAKRAELAHIHAQKEREARKSALDASRRAFESTAERYRVGAANQTERIDAEATLASAESDSTRAETGLAKAVWQLRYALGVSMEVQP